MKKFSYWDHSKLASGILMFEVIAATITEADDLFKKQFGFHPVSKLVISCIISEA